MKNARIIAPPATLWDRPPRDPVSERRPLDQLQHQRPHPLGFLDAVDGGDVGMVEAGENLRFPREPGEPVRVPREGVGEDLQRDLAVELVSVACQTWPIPPWPSSAMIAYGPRWSLAQEA